jgi:acetylornithine deacetylase
VAFSHLAVNPLDKALQLRDAIYKLGEARAARVHHPGKYTTTCTAPCASKAGTSDRLSLTDAALEEAVGRSTNVLVATMRSGDSSAARIPAACEMEGAISYPPPETLLGVQEEFQKCIDKVRLNRGLRRKSCAGC